MTPLSQIPNAKELRQYEQTRNIDGVLVKVKCYLVQVEQPHFEIHLTTCGQSAIVDVAPDREAYLVDRINQAVAVFTASIKLRDLRK